MNTIISEPIQQYAEAHTTDQSSLLKKIESDTHALIPAPQMLSGFFQGRILSMISRMIAPLNILEIGTYTGYSAICLAEGLASGGRLVTLDINKELEDRVKGYFSQAGLSDVIDYRIGDAKEIIPSLTIAFNLVFIDADKAGYPTYYEQVIDKVLPGGYILVDNVLWSGEVLNAEPDERTRSIVAFNTMIHRDKRVENALLPIRDGIMIIRKK